MLIIRLLIGYTWISNEQLFYNVPSQIINTTAGVTVSLSQYSWHTVPTSVPWHLCRVMSPSVRDNEILVTHVKQDKGQRSPQSYSGREARGSVSRARYLCSHVLTTNEGPPHRLQLLLFVPLIKTCAIFTQNPWIGLQVLMLFHRGSSTWHKYRALFYICS
jgi:hypothetical protein